MRGKYEGKGRLEHGIRLKLCVLGQTVQWLQSIEKGQMRRVNWLDKGEDKLADVWSYSTLALRTGELVSLVSISNGPMRRDYHHCHQIHALCSHLRLSLQCSSLPFLYLVSPRKTQLAKAQYQEWLVENRRARKGPGGISFEVKRLLSFLTPMSFIFLNLVRLSQSKDAGDGDGHKMKAF